MDQGYFCTIKAERTALQNGRLLSQPGHIPSAAAHHYVGAHTLPVDRQHAAGPGDAGLDLVGDHEDVVLAAQLAYLPQVALGGDHHLRGETTGLALSV